MVCTHPALHTVCDVGLSPLPTFVRPRMSAVLPTPRRFNSTLFPRPLAPGWACRHAMLHPMDATMPCSGSLDLQHQHPLGLQIGGPSPPVAAVPQLPPHELGPGPLDIEPRRRARL